MTQATRCRGADTADDRDTQSFSNAAIHSDGWNLSQSVEEVLSPHGVAPDLIVSGVRRNGSRVCSRKLGVRAGLLMLDEPTNTRNIEAGGIRRSRGRCCSRYPGANRIHNARSHADPTASPPAFMNSASRPSSYRLRATTTSIAFAKAADARRRSARERELRQVLPKRKVDAGDKGAAHGARSAAGDGYEALTRRTQPAGGGLQGAVKSRSRQRPAVRRKIVADLGTWRSVTAIRFW